MLTDYGWRISLLDGPLVCLGFLILHMSWNSVERHMQIEEVRHGLLGGKQETLGQGTDNHLPKELVFTRHKAQTGCSCRSYELCPFRPQSAK